MMMTMLISRRNFRDVVASDRKAHRLASRRKNMCNEDITKWYFISTTTRNCGEFDEMINPPLNWSRGATVLRSHSSPINLNSFLLDGISRKSPLTPHIHRSGDDTLHRAHPITSHVCVLCPLVTGDSQPARANSRDDPTQVYGNEKSLK